MIRSDFEPLFGQMRALLDQAAGVAERIGKSELRAAHLYSLRLLERAFANWKETQLNEVFAGTRPLERWTLYGAELVDGAKRVIRDAGESAAQFARIADFFGNAATAMLEPLAAQVRELRARVETLGKRRAKWEDARAKLANRPLSADARKLLFGTEAATAVTNLKNLGNIVVGLETGLSLLRSGKASLQKTADGRDLSITPLSGDAAMTLGATAPIVAAVTLGTIAVAMAITVSLKAYFDHADEVVRSELSKLELEAIKGGKGDEVIKLRELRNESDKQRGEDSTADTLETFAKVIGALGAGYVGYRIIDAILEDRRAARGAR